MEERRKFFRFEIPVDVKYASERDRTEARCRTKNISKEGVAIATDRQLAQDDILKMEFEIPGDNIPVFAHGTVVWVRENKAKMKDGLFDAGIKLIHITHFDRNRVLDYAYKQWLKIRALTAKGVL